MKSGNFYARHLIRENNIGVRKVKQKGYIEEYDGFRLCGYKQGNKWIVIEEITGLSVGKTYQTLKDGFEDTKKMLEEAARCSGRSVPEYLAPRGNVNGYEEYVYDTDKQ